MAKNYFMEEVSALKQVIREASRIREYSGDEMKRLVEEKLAERVEWARLNNEELYWYYQNLQGKKHLKIHDH